MDFLNALDKVLGIRRKAKPAKHKLKWKIPEARLTVKVKDVDDAVLLLEKKLRLPFTSGGEYFEIVHAKEYGNGVYAYLLVRTNAKTEEETIAADAYMLQEEDTLGFDVTSAFKLDENLEQLGYSKVLERAYRVWSFRSLELSVKVYDVDGFGAFVEVAIPATNFDDAREKAEKRALELLQKLGYGEKDVIPNDVITLQLNQKHR